MMEKKLAPDMNVMTSVRTRVRGAWAIRLGNMGNLANLASQTTNNTQKTKPKISGTRTCADPHLYYVSLESTCSHGCNTYLIASPLHTADEQEHTNNTEKASNEVDLTEKFFLG